MCNFSPICDDLSICLVRRECNIICFVVHKEGIQRVEVPNPNRAGRKSRVEVGGRTGGFAIAQIRSLSFGGNNKDRCDAVRCPYSL